MSYDSTAILEHYAERANISYPLLSDEGSKFIRELGILNETIAPDHDFFGIPHPGTYLIGADRKVQSKYFEDSYRDRFSAASVIIRELDGFGETQGEAQAKNLKLRWGAATNTVAPGQRVTLELVVDLPEKMHVYAPEVDGYIPISWEIEPREIVTLFDAEYPDAEMLHLPAIDETVPVYEGAFRILRDVRVNNSRELAKFLDDGKITLNGKFRYQACDDKVCYIPETVPVKWTLAVKQHDRTRVPNDLRAKVK